VAALSGESRSQATNHFPCLDVGLRYCSVACCPSVCTVSNMAFTNEDRILIRVLRQEKGYNARRLLKEFPHKHWCRRSLFELIAKIDARIRDVNHLKERLVEEWSLFDQSIVDLAVKEWRDRLRACIQAEGGHFEHKLH
jgi:hypothetical protein